MWLEMVVWGSGMVGRGQSRSFQVTSLNRNLCGNLDVGRWRAKATFEIPLSLWCFGGKLHPTKSVRPLDLALHYEILKITLPGPSKGQEFLPVLDFGTLRMFCEFLPDVARLIKFWPELHS